LSQVFRRNYRRLKQLVSLFRSKYKIAILG